MDATLTLPPLDPMIMADDIRSSIEKLVLTLHQRNGGDLTAMDWGWRLLEPALKLDSLDLAEIVVAIEKDYRVSLFDLPQPPRTWDEVVRQLEEHH